MRKKTKDFEKLLYRPKVKSWRILFRTHRAVFQYLDSEMRKKDCSISKFQILLLIYFNGPMTPVALSRSLNVSRANTTTFLRRIVKEGLIEATTEGGSEKRPAFNLTPKGEEYFEGVFPDHIDDIEKIYNFHNEDVNKKYLQIIGDLGGNVDA
jgi:DNA-binding MarR family transcriptional regulator